MAEQGLKLTIGTFAVASGLLGEHFDDTFFKVVDCLFTILVVICWLIVSFKCIEHTIDGKLFFEQPGAEKLDDRDIKAEKAETSNSDMKEIAKSAVGSSTSTSQQSMM